MNTLLLMPGLALIALASGSQAQPVAPDGTETVQSSVQYGDLDLGSVNGRSVLKHRMAIAAGTVCTIGRFDSAGTAIADPACVRAALAKADRQMTTAIAERKGPPVLVLSSPAPLAGR